MTTDYILHGSQVNHVTVTEAGADNTVTATSNLHFYYDASNRPIALDFNGEKYFYVHNVHNDIAAILDSNGTIVVEYKYNAWGKLLATTGSLTATPGKLNPFRYRGYVYDEESRLYYLRNRYYNPELQRFISADTVIGEIGGILATNSFAYVANNPNRYDDANGTSLWDIVEKVAIATVVVATAVVVTAAIIGTGGGAAAFAFAGAGIASSATATATAIGITAAETGIAAAGALLFAKAAQKVSTPGNMNQQVKRNQAPKEVDSVHGTHTGAEEPHVHFKDGTSLTQSGGVHDKVNGVPKLTNAIRKWLRLNGWADFIKP